MKYLKNEIILLQNTKKNESIPEKERLALAFLLDSYNKIYSLALSQQKYIKEKRPEYAKNMDDNFKLLERNEYLENEVKTYKDVYKKQLTYIQNIEKELRMTKKLLAIQDESNSKK